MRDCPLCQGSGVIRTYSSFGMQVSPCPNCNESRKCQRHCEFAEMRRRARHLTAARKDN